MLSWNSSSSLCHQLHKRQDPFCLNTEFAEQLRLRRALPYVIKASLQSLHRICDIRPALSQLRVTKVLLAMLRAHL